MYDYSMDKDRIFRMLNSHNEKIKELQDHNKKLREYIEALESSLSYLDLSSDPETQSWEDTTTEMYYQVYWNLINSGK